ncbi:PQQ-binding-like beta-propeller repeat protein [Ferruginibacter sp. SUN002]|uniref:outer membrane protein assembly factor BamB family protein n=1 Tax=Ferruginibacter sp. SUN002 TaxID=2937789 RepID=UPI003D364B17
MKKTCVLIFALILSMTSFCQKTTPEFSIPVGNFVMQPNFLKQSDVGILVVSTPTSLVGIDPRKKEKAWETKEVKDIKEEEFKIIEGTPYIMVEFQKFGSIAKNKTVAIFNSFTGAMAYNSRDEDIKVRNTRIVPELKGLFIEGVKESQNFIGFLDFESSTVTWTKSFGKVKTGGIGLGALKRAIKSHLESIFNVEPVTDASGNFIFSNKETVYCVNGKTGNEVWTKEFKDDITDFILAPDGKGLFVVYDDRMEKVESSTGTPLYEDPIKLDGKVNGFMPIANGANVVMHDEGFNILEPNGKFRWKKDASVGNISQVWEVSDGYIALEQDEKGGKVFKVTSEGKKKWDETLSDPIYTVQPIASGVIYITKEKANILGYEKGKDVWKKDIKIKGNPSFGADVAKKLVYVYSNKSLSAFNFNDGSYKEIVEEIKLKDYDDDKELATIECRGDNVFIQSNQNVAMVKGDGTVLYNKFFTEAGMSKGMRGLMKGLGAVAEVAGAATVLNGAMKPADWKVTGSHVDAATGVQVYEVTSKQMAAGSAINQGGSELYAFAQARYFATQSTKNTVYILSKWDEGTGLVVLDKETGNELKRIVFNDKKPKYIVDEADYKVYVLVNDKEIASYSLK